MVVFLFILVTSPLIVIAFGIMLSGPRYKGPVSDHFDGKRFINPQGIQAKGVRDVFKWMMTRKRGSWTNLPEPQKFDPPPGRVHAGVAITFVNHSTFLIQVDGLNILTDPVWSKRTSPFTWAGPQRKRLPGVAFEDIPKVDLVLLSHNHYDHLDIQTMRMIFGAHHPKIVTPLGVKAFLDEERISGAIDIDWWDELVISNTVRVRAVPAQHFSGRGSLDRDATLWCGYVLETSEGNVYFAGDTGYNNTTFKEIGEKFGPMKISLLPIGAYKPSWFMSPVHTCPEEAVRIHFEVKSEQSVATHFGTFPLADEACDEPVSDLKEAMQKYKLKENKFLVLHEGETQRF
ncbi:MAG: MBL fold metallo-hydrolase [Bacteroidota bacterium]